MSRRRKKSTDVPLRPSKQSTGSGTPESSPYSTNLPLVARRSTKSSPMVPPMQSRTTSGPLPRGVSLRTRPFQSGSSIVTRPVHRPGSATVRLCEPRIRPTGRSPQVSVSNSAIWPLIAELAAVTTTERAPRQYRATMSIAVSGLMYEKQAVLSSSASGTGTHQVGSMLRSCCQHPGPPIGSTLLPTRLRAAGTSEPADSTTPTPSKPGTNGYVVRDM